jgi:segregation and condensation protein B
MDIAEIKKILEAILLAAARPLTVEQLQSLFAGGVVPERGDIRAALKELVTDYENRGIELKQVASGYRIQVREEMQPWISRLWEEKPARYSRALLETLSLIAYRQPITRGEIEDVRGVSVSTSIIRTLLEREWVKVVGHRDVPGRPAMYATTRQFLDYFSLKSLDELPTLAELRDLSTIGAELELDFSESVAETVADTQMAANDPGDETDETEPAPVEDADEPNSGNIATIH